MKTEETTSVQQAPASRDWNDPLMPSPGEIKGSMDNQAENPPECEAANTPAEVRRSTVSSLRDMWEKCVAVENHAGFVKPLTKKERGQLWNLFKSLGDRTAEVITFALSDWSTFASRIERQAGLFTSHQYPDMGFLLKYHGVAMKLIADDLQSIARAEEERLKLKRHSREIAEFWADQRARKQKEWEERWIPTPEELRELHASLSEEVSNAFPR